MSKFGDLIDVDVPVLFDFFSEQDDSSAAMHEVLRDVASALGNKAKVIKIDVNKNKGLSQALRIKSLPTLIIYKFGDMKWRQSGKSDATTIISICKIYSSDFSSIFKGSFTLNRSLYPRNFSFSVLTKASSS